MCVCVCYAPTRALLHTPSHTRSHTHALTHASRSLKAGVIAKAGLQGDGVKRVTDGLRWVGLFSGALAPRKRSLLDSLAATLADKMRYLPGERDMLMLQHRFGIEKADGSMVCVCV